MIVRGRLYLLYSRTWRCKFFRRDFCLICTEHVMASSGPVIIVSLIMKNPFCLVFALIIIPQSVSWATSESDAFWSTCQEKIGTTPADGTYRLRRFGNNAALADVLLNLIISGQKTGTYALPWLFEGDENLTPVAGGYSVVTDSDGKPRVLLLTTSLKTLPYNQITEEETQYEGPNARALEVWRQIHWPYFSRALELKGKTPTEEMPVTLERFEVVCDGTS